MRRRRPRTPWPRGYRSNLCMPEATTPPRILDLDQQAHTRFRPSPHSSPSIGLVLLVKASRVLPAVTCPHDFGAPYPPTVTRQTAPRRKVLQLTPRIPGNVDAEVGRSRWIVALRRPLCRTRSKEPVAATSTSSSLRWACPPRSAPAGTEWTSSDAPESGNGTAGGRSPWLWSIRRAPPAGARSWATFGASARANGGRQPRL